MAERDDPAPGGPEPPKRPTPRAPRWAYVAVGLLAVATALLPLLEEVDVHNRSSEGQRMPVTIDVALLWARVEPKAGAASEPEADERLLVGYWNSEGSGLEEVIGGPTFMVFTGAISVALGGSLVAREFRRQDGPGSSMIALSAAITGIFLLMFAYVFLSGFPFCSCEAGFGLLLIVPTGISLLALSVYEARLVSERTTRRLS